MQNQRLFVCPALCVIGPTTPKNKHSMPVFIFISMLICFKCKRKREYTLKVNICLETFFQCILCNTLHYFYNLCYLMQNYFLMHICIKENSIDFRNFDTYITKICSSYVQFLILNLHTSIRVKTQNHY